MSQHDFNIANQTFPSFRADLNNALVAAATMSAGASAPTTPYPYQLWFDTTTGTWKVRNSGNTAWISTITTDLATGSVNISNSSGATLKLTSTDTSGADTELLGQIDFVSSDVSGGSAGTQARIKGVYEDNGDSSGLAFLTGASTGSGSPTLNEVMRIRHEGRVGIGISSPTQALVVSESSTPTIQIKDGAASGTRVSGRLHIGEADNLGVSIENSTNSYNDNCTMVFKTSPAAGTITERMRIDSVGRISINTAAATELLNVAASAGNGAGIEFAGNGTTLGSTSAFYGQGSGSDAYVWNRANNPILFGTNNAEKMRLDSSGKLTISSYGTGNHDKWDFSGSYGASSNIAVAGNSTRLSLQAAGVQIGAIFCSASATSFLTSSDYRLKTAVTYDWDATSRLKQLKPARFAWIADGDDAVPVDGFLAHEVQTVVPEAITGEKDGMRDEEYTVSAATGDIYTPAVEATYDEDGVELTAAVDEVIHSADVERPEELAESQQWRETTAAVMGTRSVPDYQGIDQSKLTPLLTKALIEAVEKIEQLEARISALEAS
jgi:hypothetical protein